MEFAGTSYRFGEFTLDLERLEFRRGGEPVDVEPQVFALLAHLLRHRNRVVDKDELFDVVWHGRIVSDATLNSRIKSVRRAVGDSGQEQAVIRTFSKRGYRFCAPVEEIAGAPAPPARPTDHTATRARPSIAVLPFVNISGDPEQEFFADGLTEELITALSRWRSFTVIARNSTFQYKGRAPDIREVAGHLGVDYVLEGSVRRSGDRVRIATQLADGSTGSHVWAERYDRDLADFFDLQDEITQVIAAKVEPAFARAEQARSAQRPPANLNAWECYQRGVASLDEVTRAGSLRARDFFGRAVALDPGSSRAHAGMAYCLFRYMLDGFSEPGEDFADEIIEMARRAIALDDTDSLAHHTLAVALLYFSGDYDLSIAEARRAVALNPNFSQAHVPLGNAPSFIGRPEEGIRHLEEALRLNPDDVRGHIYDTYLGEARLNNRDYEGAAECARKGFRRKPDYAYSYFILASALGHLGRKELAAAALEQCLDIQPEYVAVHGNLHRYRDPVDREHILDGLRAAGWTGSRSDHTEKMYP